MAKRAKVADLQEAENHGIGEGAVALAERARSTWEDRIVGHGSEAPEQLLANPNNARIHPGSQQAALLAVMRRIGWVAPVIVNQRTGFVVDGHLRVQTAISEGQATVPVLYVDLSDEEEEEILLEFDALGSLAAYDGQMLSESVSRVQERLDAESPIHEMLEALVAEFPVPRDPFEGNEGDPDAPGDEHVPSNSGEISDDLNQDAGEVVRVVELRFTEEAGDLFLKRVAALITHHGETTIEDVLARVVEDAHRALGVQDIQ